MGIPVKLQVFEGPLDLLLHLIDKNKIDIYDIPIVEITSQYMDYIKAMESEDLNVMSEFLVMAATLLDIKCRMLLPKEVEEEEEECTLTCGRFATLDEATCTCKLNTTIGGGIVGGGGFIKACNGKTCPTGQSLDTTTCTCKGGISNPCPGVSCTNGSINILTCKCIGYIERN